MRHRSANRKAAEVERPGGERRADPIDIHVGARIRFLRRHLSLSQKELGAALGITCQQVQKYEGGLNRVSASRLFELARVLAVPISALFEGMPERPATAAPPPSLPQSSDIADLRHVLGTDASSRQREIMALIRAYDRISHPGVRNAVLDLISHLALAHG